MTTKTTKTKTTKPTPVDTIEVSKKDLPSLRDVSGSSLELTIDNINSIGTQAGTGIGKLADDILHKVNGVDNGEFGKSVTTILALTRSVDIDSLGEPQSGILGRIKGLFVDVKRKVGDQYKTSYEQIEEIVGTLGTGVDRMRSESDWLGRAYDANIDYYKQLEKDLENIIEVRSSQDPILEKLRKEDDSQMHVFEQQKMLCDALEKQEDKIRRLIHMCKLQAPQIRSMMAVNVGTIDKFKSLTDIVIPAWKTQLSLGLISDQQRKDNELGNVIDDETNRLLSSNANLIATNMKEAAKAGQRGVVDIKTLRDAQTKMINGITEALAIEQRGKDERRAAAIELENMNQELKTTLKAIADKSKK